MTVWWVLVIVLSVVVLVLEAWSRSSGRSRDRTGPITRTVRVGTTAGRSSPERAMSLGRVRPRGDLPERASVVEGAEPRRAATAWPWPLSRTLRAAAIIRAPGARVWDVLGDFASYPYWNPYICRIRGEAREGTRIEVSTQPPGHVGMICRARLVEVSAGRALRWRHRLLLPGMLDHEYRCLIEPLGGDMVRLEQQEVYTGLLVPFLPRGLDGSTLEGFRVMHEALREQTKVPDRS
jgi:hypothetical protein